MQASKLASPSPWRTLLWKDWQQVRQLCLAIAIGFGVIQALPLAIGLFIEEADSRLGMLGATFVFCTLAPFVGAVGCSGMLIGHERQAGSWAWSSSLPVPWLSALGSKLLISCLACGLLALVMTIIPALLVISGQVPIRIYALPSSWEVGLPLVLFIEVLAVYFLATLLFRNTLVGIVVATVALLVAQALLLEVSFSLIEQYLPREDLAAVQWQVTTGIEVACTIAFLLTTACAFRWRWRSGQTWEFAPFAAGFPVELTDASRVLPTRIRSQTIAPSEWTVLLWQSLQNSFALRLVVVLAAALLSLYSRQTDNGGLSISIAVSACCFLGLTAFEGDQTHGRYRFLSDRGVSPWKLTVSRLLVPMALATALVAAMLTLIPSLRQLSPPFVAVPYCLTAFSVLALSSLCFRQAVVSSTAGIVVLLLGMYLTVAILEFTRQPSFLNSYGLSTADHYRLFVVPAYYLSLLGWLLPTAGTFWLLPKWIKLEASNLHLHFWWLAILAVASPILLSCGIILLSL